MTGGRGNDGRPHEMRPYAILSDVTSPLLPEAVRLVPNRRDFCCVVVFLLMQKVVALAKAMECGWMPTFN